MKYSGKIGAIMWIVIILVEGVLGGLCAIPDYSNPAEYVPLISLYVIVTAFVLWFFVRNYYILTEDMIKVCLGPSTTKVMVDSISSVKKVNSVIASGAGSTRRIEISYNDGRRQAKTYISPKNEDDFIARLCGYNTSIKVFEPER